MFLFFFRAKVCGDVFTHQIDAPGVQRHYKNLLEVEEAFCELKSYLKVRPVFHRKPERVLNHVRICFLAYWISARLAREWRASGETGEVTRILRELQTIRLGQISVGTPGSPLLARLTKAPAHLNFPSLQTQAPLPLRNPSQVGRFSYRSTDVARKNLQLLCLSASQAFRRGS